MTNDRQETMWEKGGKNSALSPIKTVFIAALISLNGLFFYNFDNASLDRFFFAQHGIMVFCAFSFGSYLIYKKDKLLGIISLVSSLGFIRSFILQQYSEMHFYRICFTAFAILAIYYFIREMRFDEKVLKLFCIPAILNSFIVIVQNFDHRLIPFFYTKGVTGFLGNKSITAYYLTLTLPIFYKYFKKFIPFVLLAIFFCDSFIAILAAILTILFILYFKNKKFFTILLVLLIILSGVFAGILVKGHLLKIREGIAFRLSSYLGTFHGIRYNPILGWGIGTFEPIIAMVKIEKSAYFMGRSFNTGSAVLNHPHNELLYGWWNIGILFPILIIALFIKKLKSFNENNLLTSAIIFCGFIIMNGCFLNPPLWILLMFALGIHDNQLEVKNGKCSEGEASG